MYQKISIHYSWVNCILMFFKLKSNIHFLSTSIVRFQLLYARCFLIQKRLVCTPPSSTFIETLISFDSYFFKMFRLFLGLNYFDSSKGLLICKQVFLPITYGGIRFIPTSTITLCPSSLFGE
jgi:hypothetical protein